MIIAIDGKSGTGKSTISYLLATSLNLRYLNSGSIYRCIAYLIMNKYLDINSPMFEKDLSKIQIDFKNIDNKQRVILNNKDVTDIIRLEEVTTFTPKIADNKIIKTYIRNIQYKFVESGNIVIEGRDICTVIAPNADYKFYLYTSVETRAERVYEEKIKKENITYEEVLNDLKKRDVEDILDKNFIEPTNAIKIDTTNLTIEEVLEIMLKNIKEAHYEK